MPVAKPLHPRLPMRAMMHLRPVHKPLVSLIPPKVNPVYKPGGYVYNKPLPVNVPPNIPMKPWQHQGWNSFKPDDKPFVPSAPGPEPDDNLPDPNFAQPVRPTAPPTSFPVVPSVNIQPHPTFNVQPVQPVFPSVPIKPAVPIQPSFPVHPVQPVFPTAPVVPAVNLQPAVPVHHPIQPNVHFPFPAPSPVPVPVHPVVPAQPSVNTFVHHNPLVPINLLPGRFNIPVPNLGVLPLGSSVPVQLTPQQPQIVHKPAVFPVASSVPVHLIPQHQHVVQKAPVLPAGPQFHFVHQHPQEVHNTPVVEPPVVQKFVPELHQAVIPRPQVYLGGPQVVPGQMPLENGFTPMGNQPERPPIQITVNQHQPDVNNILSSVPERHNFQYFMQHFPSNNIQHQHAVNLQAQNYETEQQQQLQEHQIQEHQNQVQEQQIFENGFYQPGKTDLQIPEYLPEHPHFKQLQYQQDNAFVVKKR